MKTHLSNARRDDIGHEPTDLMLLSDPLDFIAEDHLRIRAVCETMDRIAQADHPTREGLLRHILDLQRHGRILQRAELVETHQPLRVALLRPTVRGRRRQHDDHLLRH